jgi:hypothetical protein
VDQLRINQRIAQAAVRRANGLAGRLEGRLPAERENAGEGGRISLTARQLLINQRISQAAVRRANALAERIPDLPFPQLGVTDPALDRLSGLLETTNRGVLTVRNVEQRGTLGDNSPVAVGDRVPVVFSGRPTFSLQTELVAIGVIYRGVMFSSQYLLDPP